MSIKVNQEIKLIIRYIDETDRKIILRAGTELKFENYESVQHRPQFSGIRKGAKISFHRHFMQSHNISVEFVFKQVLLLGLH